MLEIHFGNTFGLSLKQNKGASINPQIAGSGNNVYAVWRDSTPQGKQEIFFTKFKYLMPDNCVSYFTSCLLSRILKLLTFTCSLSILLKNI
jgi:hypothetical protein